MTWSFQTDYRNRDLCVFCVSMKMSDEKLLNKRDTYYRGIWNWFFIFFQRTIRSDFGSTLVGNRTLCFDLSRKVRVWFFYKWNFQPNAMGSREFTTRFAFFQPFCIRQYSLSWWFILTSVSRTWMILKHFHSSDNMVAQCAHMVLVLVEINQNFASRF